MAFDLTYLILHFIGCNGTCRPMLAVPGSPFTHWLGIFFMWHFPGYSSIPQHSNFLQAFFLKSQSNNTT